MRLQVMHLPAPADEYPFMFIFDQCDDAATAQWLSDKSAELRSATGAKAVLSFEGEVEVA